MDQTRHLVTNSMDRFPFMARPPQFKMFRPSLEQLLQGLTLGPRPSPSNPNVVFCAPEDTARARSRLPALAEHNSTL